jgi:hypothetical protein
MDQASRQVVRVMYGVLQLASSWILLKKEDRDFRPHDWMRGAGI